MDKARKVMENPLSTDLKSFLTATFALCKSRVVKKDIANVLHELENNYRLSA
jgi:hypothetical protein